MLYIDIATRCLEIPAMTYCIPLSAAPGGFAIVNIKTPNPPL